MAAKLLETELPIPCTWCGKPLQAFLDVPSSGNTSDRSLILCKACDLQTVATVRRRVVSVGHLEKRDDVYVWVEGRLPGTRRNLKPAKRSRKGRVGMRAAGRTAKVHNSR